MIKYILISILIITCIYYEFSMLSVTIKHLFLYTEMCMLQKNAKANDAKFFYEKEVLLVDLLRYKNAYKE